jgi:hypothetical protein
MTRLADALLIASGVQGGSVRAPARVPVYETVELALVIAAMVAALLAIGIYLRRRRRRQRPVKDQWQALVVMGELCPHGWQAEITLYGWGAPVPDDAPASRVPLVELEWKQFDEESGHVAVARRVWASTISEALQTMIDDRRTDLTLEEIEQSVDDEQWGGD